jgi:hypothetical protein
MDTEGFDSNPYDGSTWFVPHDLPPRQLVEPEPFVLEWEDEWVADTRVEAAWRRESFTEGKWIKGIDGYDWCLPVLDEAAYDAFPRIREVMRLSSTIEFDEDGDPIPAPSDVCWTCGQAAMVLLFDLLESNYHATRDDMGSILGNAEDGWNFQPILDLYAHMNASKELTLCCVAERIVWDRNEARSLAFLAPCTGPLRGWDKHEGDVFPN